MPVPLLLALALLAPADIQPTTPNALRAHVKFLASDALKGRATPSPELEIAAEYIAARFEELGLAPGNGNSYFQKGQYTPFARQGERTSGVVEARNVIGLLRGTDPTLKDTYIIVSAHYDHLGESTSGDGDRIYNGANDDASGVAGVIECARALVNAKPKRSIVFMTFYGEERGLKGSTFYGTSPVFPLKSTIAQVNLEQIGRTDDTEGPRVGAFNLTGFDYTNIANILEPVAKKYGVKLERHPRNSDPYFMRSDNAALARVGIPSTTVSVAYEYPDYHQAGDHWDKLDYENTAKVVNSIAAGLLSMANSSKAVEWNASNPKVARYIEAQKALGG